MSRDPREEIVGAFPIIDQIVDNGLKEVVIRAWQRALREGSFERIDQIPYSLAFPEVKLVDHIRWVLDAALQMASLAEGRMGISLDRELLIAAAILHDLGKAFEYREGENGPEETDIGRQFPHGFWGTHVAMEEGASRKLAHLIATHGHQSPIPPQLPEGIILHYADYGNADLLRLQKGMETFLSRRHGAPSWPGPGD
jgi:7,8-dihydroneopterin 2',3'-cyclic phosphate phosphodiesterase